MADDVAAAYENAFVRYRSEAERKYAQRLEVWRLAGLIQSWRHEPCRFKLAERTSYMPDFEVVDLSGHRHYVEVKGWHQNIHVSRVKWKIAASFHPEHSWWWATYHRKTDQWKHIKYGAKRGHAYYDADTWEQDDD